MDVLNLVSKDARDSKEKGHETVSTALRVAKILRGTSGGGGFRRPRPLRV